MGRVKVTLPGQEGGGSAVRKVLSRPLDARLGKKGDGEFTDLTSPIAGIQSGALLGNGRGQTRAQASGGMSQSPSLWSITSRQVPCCPIVFVVAKAEGGVTFQVALPVREML